MLKIRKEEKKTYATKFSFIFKRWFFILSFLVNQWNTGKCVCNLKLQKKNNNNIMITVKKIGIKKGIIDIILKLKKKNSRTVMIIIKIIINSKSLILFNEKESSEIFEITKTYTICNVDDTF